ncbi:MAG TPA: SRPBCC domain-containing protein [Verrucomicrobiae bacterium]|nr:SRPBCC domain-containing protein [Verrucomicrobiae bacterium]
MDDKLEQQIIINAPITTVWAVLTRPEHIIKWFSDRVDIDVRPGGKGLLSWDTYGDAPLEVVRVDEPNLFSFAWVGADEETREADQQTLVEFRLTEVAGGTKLLLTETIYGKLKLTEEKKNSLFEKHRSGWSVFADRIKQHAEAQ